jgi:hypothetical protein
MSDAYLTVTAFRLRVVFWLLLGDDYGGGYFVLVFEVEQLDARGAAASGADGFRRSALSP